MDLHSQARIFPKYAQVDEIILWEDEKLFVVNLLEVTEFCEHRMAYVFQPTYLKEVHSSSRLLWCGVLHMIRLNSKNYVVENDTADVELA